MLIVLFPMTKPTNVQQALIKKVKPVKNRISETFFFKSTQFMPWL